MALLLSSRTRFCGFCKKRIFKNSCLCTFNKKVQKNKSWTAQCVQYVLYLWTGYSIQSSCSGESNWSRREVADSLRVWLASITTVRRQGQPQVNLTYTIQFSINIFVYGIQTIFSSLNEIYVFILFFASSSLSAAHITKISKERHDFFLSLQWRFLPSPTDPQPLWPFLSHSLSSFCVAGRGFA